MINDIGGVTSKMVSIALDAALLRHQVIANNIANVNTPSYQAKRMSFEGYFTEQALAASRQGDSAGLRREIELFKGKLGSSGVLQTTAKPVALDDEMRKLAENVIRYRAILNGNSKRGELLSMAINGGKS